MVPLSVHGQSHGWALGPPAGHMEHNMVPLPAHICSMFLRLRTWIFLREYLTCLLICYAVLLVSICNLFIYSAIVRIFTQGERPFTTENGHSRDRERPLTAENGRPQGRECPFTRERAAVQQAAKRPMLTKMGLDTLGHQHS